MVPFCNKVNNKVNFEENISYHSMVRTEILNMTYYHYYDLWEILSIATPLMGGKFGLAMGRFELAISRLALPYFLMPLYLLNFFSTLM